MDPVAVDRQRGAAPLAQRLRAGMAPGRRVSELARKPAGRVLFERAQARGTGRQRPLRVAAIIEQLLERAVGARQLAVELGARKAGELLDLAPRQTVGAQERDLARTLGQLGQQCDRLGELKTLRVAVAPISDLSLRTGPIRVGWDGVVTVRDPGERGVVAVAPVQRDCFVARDGRHVGPPRPVAVGLTAQKHRPRKRDRVLAVGRAGVHHPRQATLQHRRVRPDQLVLVAAQRRKPAHDP